MICAVDLTHHYGIRPILKHINLEIKTGEVVVVVGPNGMGKSTLLGVLAGVLWPHTGYVEFDGIKRRQSVDGEQTLRRKIVYLPDQAWLPKMHTGANSFWRPVGSTASKTCGSSSTPIGCSHCSILARKEISQSLVTPPGNARKSPSPVR